MPAEASEERLAIAADPTDRGARLVLRGRLDVATAAAAAIAIDRRLGPGKEVHVDLSEVTYIDHAGLRTLIGAHGRASSVACAWRLTAPRSPSGRRPLERTGTLQALTR